MSAQPWIVPPLVLPVSDEKRYTVQPTSYDDGLSLVALSSGKKTDRIALKSADSELFKLVMADTWDEMMADRQPFPTMFRAGMASLQYQLALVAGVDPTAAVELGESFWNSGTDPEAVAAAMAADPSTTTTSTPSTSTGSGRKTRSPGSTRTTTSRPATPRKKPAKKASARPSPGTTSPASTS
jgi:cell division septation protein DedD